MVLVAKYFIDFKKYVAAWEVLEKEEKSANKNKNYLLNLRIQRLKLDILPYYPLVDFEPIKNKIISLQKQQAKMDEFQLCFIQIKNIFRSKLEKGEVNISSVIINEAIQQYDFIKDEIDQPELRLKVMEILRAEYAIQKKYHSLAKIFKDYYKQESVTSLGKDKETQANIEYIMAYTFLELRNFSDSQRHLVFLKKLMDAEERILLNYIGRYIAIESFIRVFENKMQQGIDLIENTLTKFRLKISNREQLNLSLNLAAFHTVNKEPKKALKIINSMVESDSFYQKNMGREWLLRKEMIKAIVLLEREHANMSLKMIHNMEKNYRDLFDKNQYGMVRHFIKTIKMYINNPHEVKNSTLHQIEKDIKLNKTKVFKDPRLIIFYSWIKSKYSKKDVYDILLDEFEKLNET